MSKPTPMTITAAAKLLGFTRQYVSTTANRLKLGTRLGNSAQSPIILMPADIQALRREFSKKVGGGKFQPGNDLHTLRKKPGRKKRSES